MNSFSRSFFLKASFCIAFTVFFSSCSDENALEAEINRIPVTIDIDRFDLKFYNATPEEYIELKKSYPYLFPNQFPIVYGLKDNATVFKRFCMPK